MDGREREGYILIDRNILDWKWWNNNNTLKVFLWLMIKAQFHESYWGGVQIKRGQVATSMKNIESDNQLSRQQVRTAISNLKSTGEITITRYSKFLVLTIVNYNKYQNPTIKATKDQQSNNHQKTIKQPHTNTYNKYKADNAEEKSLRSELFPCGATKKPEWMDDNVWDDVRYRKVEDIPSLLQGDYDTYIEYVEAEHERGVDIR